MSEPDMNDDYHRGYKVGWEAANGRRDVPSLPAGTQISTATFVVDTSGDGWWIDPNSRRCERQKDRSPVRDMTDDALNALLGKVQIVRGQP